MKNKNLKSGTIIKVYLDGGWEIEGSVIEDLEDRIILEEGEDPVLLFKSKINAIRILPDKTKTISPEKSQDRVVEVESEPKRPFVVVSKTKDSGSTPKGSSESTPYYLEGGMSLPMSVINADPDKINPLNGDEFSISFKQLKDVGGSGNINISLVTDKDE